MNDQGDRRDLFPMKILKQNQDLSMLRWIAAYWAFIWLNIAC